MEDSRAQDLRTEDQGTDAPIQTQTEKITVSIWDLVLKELALVKGWTLTEREKSSIDTAMKVTHKESMAVCARIEPQLQCGKFLHPADFSSDPNCRRQKIANKCMSPAEDTTLIRVVSIIEARWKEVTGSLNKPSPAQPAEKSKPCVGTESSLLEGAGRCLENGNIHTR